MNTRASVAYGWGVLILAGGGAYYFAKRSINADRAERAAGIERERQYIQKLRESEYTSKPAQTHVESTQQTRTPIAEAAAPEPTAEEKVNASKYAAARPYRSPRGDRFS